MELHRYDIVEAEITMTSPSGSVQKKKDLMCWLAMIREQ